MFFFFNTTPTTEIYTLSLHDALPIYARVELPRPSLLAWFRARPVRAVELHRRSAECLPNRALDGRSEERRVGKECTARGVAYREEHNRAGRGALPLPREP